MIECYLANEGNFPPLNEAQIEKLRRLTLVTLASESHVPFLLPEIN